jgi:hypothetical protein
VTQLDYLVRPYACTNEIIWLDPSEVTWFGVQTLLQTIKNVDNLFYFYQLLGAFTISVDTFYWNWLKNELSFVTIIRYLKYLFPPARLVTFLKICQQNFTQKTILWLKAGSCTHGGAESEEIANSNFQQFSLFLPLMQTCLGYGLPTLQKWPSHCQPLPSKFFISSLAATQPRQRSLNSADSRPASHYLNCCKHGCNSQQVAPPPSETPKKKSYTVLWSVCM